MFNAATKHRYATDLLTANPEDLRDSEQARRVALEAAELTGHGDPEILGTLALAYHLTGDTRNATETQLKALSLLSEFQMALDEGR